MQRASLRSIAIVIALSNLIHPAALRADDLKPADSVPKGAVGKHGLDAQGQDQPRKDGWIPLFSGKDLSGWKPKIKGYDLGENYGNTFRVENGLLKVSWKWRSTATASSSTLSTVRP